MFLQFATSSYFEKIFTNHRIKYSPKPVPKSSTAITKAMRIKVTSQPNLWLSHSETPKIILIIWFLVYSKVLKVLNLIQSLNLAAFKSPTQ